jgi:hypothetical protein
MTPGVNEKSFASCDVVSVSLKAIACQEREVAQGIVIALVLAIRI